MKRRLRNDLQEFSPNDVVARLVEEYCDREEHARNECVDRYPTQFTPLRPESRNGASMPATPSLQLRQRVVAGERSHFEAAIVARRAPALERVELWRGTGISGHTGWGPLPFLSRVMQLKETHSCHQLGRGSAAEWPRSWIASESSNDVRLGTPLACDFFFPGDPWALVELGTLFAVKFKNFELSFKCFAMAAERGSAVGMLCLGDQFVRGLGVAQNRLLGQRLVEKAKTVMKDGVRRAPALGAKSHKDLLVHRSIALWKDARFKPQLDLRMRARAFRQ